MALDLNGMEAMMEELKKPVEEQPVEEEQPVTQDITEAPVEEAVEEPVEEDEEAVANSEDGKKKGKYYSKLRHEAAELKAKYEAAEKDRQEMRERLARLEGAKDATTPKVEAKTDSEPDGDLYPEDHTAWKMRQLEKRLEGAEAIAKDAQQHTALENARRAVGTIESGFKSTNPKEDYDGAVGFLMERERSVKKLMNPNMTDAQINGQIEVEKMQLFAQLSQSGRNPAEVVMQLAKSHGFTAKQGDVVSKKVNLDRIEDNQRRATNLIGGSPASKGDKVTSESVLSDSFNNILVKSQDPNYFNKLINGVN